MSRPATTRTARREIERRLVETPAGEPPEDLLARLRAEVPERPELAAAPPAGRTAFRRPLAAAAVVVLAVGGAWMLWRLSGQVLAPAAAERSARPTAAVAGEGGAKAGSAPRAGDEAHADRPRRETATERAQSLASSSGGVERQESAEAVAPPLDLAAPPAAPSTAGDAHRDAAGGGAPQPGAPRLGPTATTGGTADEPTAPPGVASQSRRARAAGVAAAPRPEAGSAPAGSGRTRRPVGSEASPAAAEGAPAPPAEQPPAATVGEEREDAVGALGRIAQESLTRLLRPRRPQPPAPAAAAPAVPATVPDYARLGDRLEVTVLDGGRRVAGAEVALVPTDGPRRSALTGGDGVARFDDVEPGRYRVIVRAEGGAPPVAVAVEVAGVSGATTPLLVQLAPAAANPLQVAVFGEDRWPLPGAVVRVEPGAIAPRAVGSDGRVELDLPPGRYQVTASLEGFVPTSREIDVPAGGSEPARVELQLPVASVAETIVVTGQAPRISSTSTSAAAVTADGGRRRGERRKSVPPPPAVPAPEPVGPLHVAAAEEAPRRAVPRHPGTTGGTTGGTTEPNDAPYGDMFFRHSGVHPFVDTAEDRLSTFGLDVDTGSWGLVQGYLRRGHRPPAEAVRVEEVVNAFDYGDPAPGRGETFRVTVEGAPSPFAPGPGYRLLRFGIRARSIDPAERRPATLTFVVDVSGSMAQGGRLELVKDALGLLLDQLRPGDRVAVVVFSDQARVALEPTDDRAAARRAIAGLATEGSTHAEAGLALGYRLAWRERRPGTANRVLLLSDGVANVGATGAESILARAAGAAADGIELTTVGVGMGNYNDVLLEQLADRGDGRYAYVDDVAAARRLFVEELAGTLETVAEEARVQVDFDPRVVERWRLLGYENRDIADERFRHDHSVDAGEIGAGHAVTALYEVRLAGEPPPSVPLAHLKLRWRDPESGRFHEDERLLRVADLAAEWETAPRSLRLAAVAAEFAEQLRGSHWAKDADPADLARHASAVAAAFPGDERAAELAALAARAARLAGGARPRDD